MMYQEEIIRYDIHVGKITSRKRIPAGRVSRVHQNLLVIGSEEGQIAMIFIRKPGLEIYKEGVQCHQKAITGFAFGSTYFLSVSLDCDLKVWSYSGVQISVVTLPLPLYGVDILNGTRDILVGTESEIMMILGTSIFDEPFEPKDDVTDNYNEKQDALCHDVMVIADDLIEDTVRVPDEQHEEVDGIDEPATAKARMAVAAW